MGSAGLRLGRESGRFHAVLLAGGGGTRFWPRSRRWRPKQFLAPDGGAGSLLSRTWSRLRRSVPPTRLWVVVPDRLRRAVTEELPGLRADRTVVEPFPRDTAPAVGLAALAVSRADPDAIMGVFPTDHVVRDPIAFEQSLTAAIRAAGSGGLICLGVRPDRPATGFGYLQCARRPMPARAVEVRRFLEKPDLGTATALIDAGNVLWNGGMFVWRVDVFLAELDRVAPRIAAGVRAHGEGRRAEWTRLPKVSVDRAVLERARDVRAVRLDAGWDDLGSWDAAVRLAKRPGARPGTVRIDSPRTEVFTDGGRVVAVIDAPDLVVVETPDAVLIVRRGASERVREVVARLERAGLGDVL